MTLKNNDGKKVEAIVFDLDGTLLNKKNCISKWTLEVLQKCKARGIILGIATARSAEKARFFSEEINADFILYNNGALIEYQGKCVSKLMMDKNLTIRMLEALLQVKESVGKITMETSDGYWEVGSILEIGLDWKKIFNLPTLKITVEIFSENLVEWLKNMFPECRISAFRDGRWYRFANVQAKKSRAIDFLSEELGVNQKNVVAFGDDYDDIDMLVKAGKGVAVKNAIKDVMQIADCVCGDSDRDGVALYINKCILNSL